MRDRCAPCAQVLSSIEASLEAREAKLLDGWHTLQQQTVALKGLLGGCGGGATGAGSRRSTGSSSAGSSARVALAEQEATAQELREIDDLLVGVVPGRGVWGAHACSSARRGVCVRGA